MRFFPILLHRAGQVNQVAVVADHAGDAGFFLVLLPQGDLFVGQRGDTPLTLVLGEDLHAIHAQALSFDQCVVHTAGDGEMASEHGGSVYLGVPVWAPGQAGLTFSRSNVLF